MVREGFIFLAAAALALRETILAVYRTVPGRLKGHVALFLALRARRLVHLSGLTESSAPALWVCHLFSF